MILDRVTFEHLLIYQRRQELPLRDLGLVLILGDNRVSAALDSNGVGKTSLISILAYLLFGQTLSGKRGDEVACRFTAAPGWGTLWLEDDDGPWAVTRGARPKRLELTGFQGLTGAEDDKVLQARLEARLGFGLRVFRNAIVFGQGTFERFAQADQADQMRMLDEIQGLDLRGALKRAGAWRDEGFARAREADVALRALEQEVAQHQAHLAGLRAAQDTFRRDQKARLAEMGVRLTAARTRVAEVRKRVIALQERAATLGAIRAQWDAIERLATKLVDAGAAYQDARRTLERAAEAENALQEQVDTLLTAGTCPRCRGAVKTPQERQRVKQAFAADRAAASAAEDSAANDARRRLKAQRDLEAAATAARKRMPEGFDARTLAAWEAEVASAPRAEQDLAAAHADEARIRAELDAERERRWEGADAIRQLEQTVAAAQKDQGEWTAKHERLVRSVAVAEYWVEAFGDRGIRSLLADSVVGFLADRVAVHLQVLAAGEVRVPISATKRLKSGGVRDDLTIATEWAWGGAGVGVGSHGQDRRVDLALFAALQDLAEAQSAHPFPLKVWDEPGDALDPRGRELFCAWVEQEARRRGGGFLITHADDIAARVRADRVWTVVLDKTGAWVEQR